MPSSGEAPPAPKVSVIIPVYNQASYLGQAIDSVLAQTWRHYELIVVDDGSTDGSDDVAKEYGGSLRYVRKTNGGGASAVNAGVRVARGEWIAILPSDDVWEPGKLARQWEAIEAHPEARFVYTDYSIIDREGRLMRRTSHPVPTGRKRQRLALLRGCFINGGSVLLRRAVFQEVGGFDETNRYAPDYDYWLRVTEKYEALRVPEPLLRYRVHPAQDSQKFRAIWVATYQVIAKAVRKEPPYVGAAVIILRWWDQGVDLVVQLHSARSIKEVRRHIGTVMETLKVLVNSPIA